MNPFTELALKVAESRRLGATAEGDAAMRLLTPLAIQTARRIHAAMNRLHRQAALDFAAEAATLIWNRIEHFETWYYGKLSDADRNNPTRDWFLAWSYSELRYRYLDWGRRQAVESHQYLNGDETLTDDQRLASEPADDADAEIPGLDLERILGFSALDGVILCCLTGQWDRIPAQAWNRWRAELRLEMPFPPADFLTARPVKRRAILTAKLGITRDVLYQRWRRLKLRFQQDPVAI